jgi:serine protease Do
MDNFIDYAIKYPDLPYEIVSFFSEIENNDGRLVQKKVFQFCSHYSRKHSLQEIPEPRLIAKMCDILCEYGRMSVLHRGGTDNTDNSYICFQNSPDSFKDPTLRFYLNKSLSYIIYGFKYIYEDYKKYILPIEYINNKGDKSIGTGFLYNHGIATARHCIEGASKIGIKGASKSNLNASKFEIPNNALLDILFIRLDQPIQETIIFSQAAEILDEVMALGYPKIPGYHCFLTAENAKVSSRYTPSIGQIVASAEDIWIRERLFLITAKIKGGNSGGPIIARNGSIVGVSVNLTEGEGDYDNLGYGTAIPVKFLDDLVNNQEKTYLDTSKIEFIDFE